MKKRSVLFYLISVLFYLAALFGIVSGNDKSMDVVWLCLGSTFLCLGSLTKARENDKDE